MPQVTSKQIKQALEDFKKVLEQVGKKDVVIICSYRGQSERGKDDSIFNLYVSDDFMRPIAVCEVMKSDILSAGE